MALRSPTEFHNYWGNGFAAYAQLPNVAGSPTQNVNVQTGDIAYVPGDGLYVNVLATLGAAIWTLSNVPIGTGIATISTARIDLYVSDINGNDANDGFTPLTALKTLTAAFAPGRNPDILAFDLVVHVGAHAGAGYTWETIDSYTLVDGACIYAYADGAGQPGEDGFTVLVATVAAAAGTTTSVVKSTAALGVDAYRGKTIEMVTGAAAGNRRTIKSNSATDIVPTVLFDAGIAPGDTYRVVEPAVDLAFAEYPATPTLLARNIGSPRKWDETVADYTQPSGLYLVNFATPNTFAMVRAENSAVYCFGIDTTAAGGTTIWLSDGCEVSFGETEQGLAYATALVVSTTAWLGWGLTADATLFEGGLSFFHMIMVGTNISVTGNGSYALLRGGNLYGSLNIDTISVSSLNVTGGVIVEIGDNFGFGLTTALLIDALGTGMCVSTTGARALVEFSLLVAPGVILTSAGVLLYATSDALIQSQHGFDTGIEVHATTFGCVALSGARIALTHDFINAFIANPSPSGDCSVDNVIGDSAALLTVTNYSAFVSASGSRVYRT